MMTTLVLVTTGLALSAQPIDAQQTNQLAEREINSSVSGIVMDASTGMGLAGVVVSISELDIHTQTNQEGEFTFKNLPAFENAKEITFEANYEGFKELYRKVNLKRNDKVVLQMKVKYPIE